VWGAVDEHAERAHGADGGEGQGVSVVQRHDLQGMTGRMLGDSDS
jgi:hypothetical protein